MEYTIQSLARKWGDALPHEEEFIYPEQFEEAGFPDLLRSWVVTLLEHQLKETVAPPMTEWADLDQEATREAWKAFLAAAARRVRLPRVYVQPVMQTALGDVLEQLLQPRVAIPHMLFGTESERSLQEVREKAQDVLVHGRLAEAVVRYMERREMDRLTREQCVQIVSKVDSALLARETPESMLEQLHPLYELFGHDAVDPTLLALFFGDKEMDAFSNRFEEMGSAVEKETLLHMLREEMEGGERSPALAAAAPETPSPVSPQAPTVVPPQAPTPEAPPSPETAWPAAPKAPPPAPSEDSILPSPAPEPLETPIWQRFIQPESAEPGGHRDRIAQWLQNDRGRFIEEIFGGAEDGYELALDELAEIESWRYATHYIQREIFDRNRVNMYGEAAIDFTDLLQSYFKEFKPV